MAEDLEIALVKVGDGRHGESFWIVRRGGARSPLERPEVSVDETTARRILADLGYATHTIATLFHEARAHFHSEKGRHARLQAVRPVSPDPGDRR